MIRIINTFASMGTNNYILLFTVKVMLAVIFFAPQASGQDDYFDEGFIRNEDYIYAENIQTVLLFKRGFELSPPIITLHSPERLMLSFDDLDADVKYYRYTIIHCNADWQESDLRVQEYIDGFEDDEIRDYTMSFNTIQPYTNYVAILPSQHLRIKKSGNYILKVFDDYNEPGNVIFTRRFMVVEHLVNIRGKVSKTMDLDRRYTGQQVDFKVVANNYYISNPYTDVHVVVRQNGRWDNMVTNIQPRMVLSNELDYSLIDDFTFNAGNEFRYFDMKTVRYKTDRMYSLLYSTEGYEVILLPDQADNRKNYITNEDINGKRLIASNQAGDNYSEGEYVDVHFVLAANKSMFNGNVYIMGALTNWQFTPENKMIYDYKLRAYVATLFLKQGYYNYCYAFLEDGSTVADVTMFESSHWETENDYSIYVYHRQQGEYYDRLIAVKYINSYK